MKMDNKGENFVIFIAPLKQVSIESQQFLQFNS
jgi:hypothetical protein